MTRVELKLLGLIFALFTVLCSCVASNLPELVDFKEPLGYFQIPMPEDWNYLCAADLGSRIYIFTPQDVSADQLETVAEFEVVFLVKFSRIFERQHDQPLEEILQEYIDYQVAVFKEEELELEGEIMGPAKILGIDGALAKLKEPEGEGTLFLGKYGSMFIELNYACDYDKKDYYQPILDTMLEGFKLLDNKFSGEQRLWTNKRKNFSIMLPQAWHPREEVGGNIKQMFISRERLRTANDIFQVGVTVTEISSFSKLIGRRVESEQDIINIWYGALEEVSQRVPTVIYGFQEIKGENKNGIIFERSYMQDSFIQEYHVILAKGDTVYDVVLEAPMMEFEIYRDLFLEAIESIKLR